MPSLRVVLDTNVLVSGLAYPEGVPGRIVAAWNQKALTVVLSQHILSEVVRVLPRLSRTVLTEAAMRDLYDSLSLTADIVEPDQEKDPDLRDPDDQPVLATLRVANADYLITGDKDLLALSNTHPIITPSAF